MFPIEHFWDDVNEQSHRMEKGDDTLFIGNDPPAMPQTTASNDRWKI